MKNLLFSLLACTCLAMFFPSSLLAQKYFTRSGHIQFYSHTPIEDIQADNHQVSSILNAQTGEIVFSLLMKSFQFEKALMQEHFNEKYVESHTYPKSTFTGKILKADGLDLERNGSYPVSVTGQLTLHGVTREVTTEGLFEVKDGTAKATATFVVKPADFDIAIPSVVRDNIAKEIEVRVNMNYEPM